ncbi:putative protein N(5)-glutamine methyltransferase [Nocardioides seonyuensis]|uniref:Methyltransferase small domain-containing protein n=1 Tax=Nocardioides seonyuensis TaxID=2518371 RepID=A0A4P7IJW7_9ACTN|nr:putative protein N(5)-glutamine methyltransferase [Nocardioides seonyuensis]
MNLLEAAARLRAAGCVFAEDEARLILDSSTDDTEVETRLRRRIAGEPLETILGWVAFAGRRLVVAQGVFVPRRRTQLLVELARARASGSAVLVELCCGVAPVAATVDAGEVHASDLSAVALECARLNAPHAELHQGDLYDALPASLRGRVDVLAANAPYVPTDAIALMPPEARDHEPTVTLDGGPDGVDLHRRIAAGAREWLAPGGVLLIETSPAQGLLTTGAMSSAGLDAHVVQDEEIGGCVAVGEMTSHPPATGA